MKNNAGFQTIALTRIHESTTNPRRIFDESKLAELAASLRTQGLIQPITRAEESGCLTVWFSGNIR